MVGEELILNEGKLKRAFKDIRERRAIFVVGIIFVRS